LKASRCETSYDSERNRLDFLLANLVKDLAAVEHEVIVPLSRGPLICLTARWLQVTVLRSVCVANAWETEPAVHNFQVTVV